MRLFAGCRGVERVHHRGKRGIVGIGMMGEGGIHPHLNPLPSRERRGSTLTSILSRRGRGGGIHPHPNPLPSRERRGSTLTSILSRRGRGGGAPSPLSSPVEGEEGGFTLTSILSRRGRGGGAPSPQSSPVEGEEGEHPHLSPLPSRERRGSTLTPYRVRGRLSILCRRGRGGGFTLTSILSRRGRGGGAPSPRIKYGAGSQSSPVEGEEREQRWRQVGRWRGFLR